MSGMSAGGFVLVAVCKAAIVFVVAVDKENAHVRPGLRELLLERY